MKKVWLLGFGFFSISLGWSLYNGFVPFFLDNYLTSTALIGFLMTIDNYFALFCSRILETAVIGPIPALVDECLICSSEYRLPPYSSLSFLSTTV